MRKHSIFISLLLIIFLSIGAVCATDTINEDILSDGDINTLGNAQDDIDIKYDSCQESVGDAVLDDSCQESVNGDVLDDSCQESVEEDVNDDCQETIVNTQDTALGIGETKSFTELSNEINGSTETFNISSNYAFNNGIDDKEGVRIDKSNLVINGNGYTIDGNNLSRIFIINGTNITINNLILKNANADRGSAIYINSGCSLTTSNVTFINNTANMGIAFAIDANYTSNDDKFLDSTSSYGVVSSVRSVLTFNNALMMSSKELRWGFIQSLANSFIKVFNSTFANTTSKYSAAIRGDLMTVIEGCNFTNLHANLSAGAIGLKQIQQAVIKNCNFTNVTSEKNGGAILIDALNPGMPMLVEINDSNFADCHSEFGGAILQLDGLLQVDNCNFTNNQAYFDGGAIYTSYTNLTINGSKFNENHAIYDKARGSFGGAIYSEAGLLILDSCELANNSAQYGGAIYLYDGDYAIENSIFNNNSDLNGVYNDLYTDFDGNMTILENNAYSSDDSLSRDNEVYQSISITPGMQISIINNTLDVSSLPTKFDLRDWGWSSPVRDQGTAGACWAFGSAGAMESAILRYLGIKIDLSENNIQDVSLKYYRYGDTLRVEGGALGNAAAYALSWLGVFSSEYDAYDELGKISPVIATNSSIHFQDVIIVPPCKDEADLNSLKEAILKYGAMAVVYCAAQTAPYFNDKTGAQYCDNESVVSNHVVTLIGWDDNYSASNFLIAPPGDGAWIVKNSWGTQWANDGYFYVSYYDTSFAKAYPSYGYIINNSIIYNKNYQYDLQGEQLFNPNANEYRNIFLAVDDDLIAAVGTFFNDANIEYSVEIYVGDELRLVQNGLSPYIGYHTIKLNSYIPIKKGEIFAVKIKSNSVPFSCYSRQNYMAGISQVYRSGEWVDAIDEGGVAIIKAYTLVDDTKIIEIHNISVDYGSGSYFKVKVVTANGHAVGAGAIVNFTINGKSYTVKTDKNGIAKIKITDLPNRYVLTTICNGKEYKNTVTVKLNLNTCKIIGNKNIKVDYAGGKCFSVKVVSADGKVAGSGASVKFTIGGKTYAVKTDKNGIAKIKITQIPKKYVIKTTFNGKTYKNTVTVRQVLKTSKVTVKKTAKRFTLKAKLKINGKLVKGKTIKFIFNGKTYSAKTNKKGIAKVTIKQKVIKKLKKGKKYAVKVTYLKDTIKTTVKVK